MKKLPFDKNWIDSVAARWPTPFHVYDAAAIRESARRLKAAFAWNAGFREYFAVKATPNPYIMKILKDEFSIGSDCSSMAELILAEKVGNVGESIMFTSNDTPAREFAKAWELGAIINFDDITHWPFFKKSIAASKRPIVDGLFCCRYNPGPLKGGNAIIGKPEEAKYGMTREQLFKCYAEIKAEGVTRFGLHTMVASNELDPEYIIDTARMLFSLVAEISSAVGIDFEFINLGGGIGIPYRPDQKAMNLDRVGDGIRAAYEELVTAKGLKPIRIFTECGRCITGPAGYLVATVLHKKDTYRKYVGLDACMSNLMRPALYGAYHEILVPGKEDSSETEVYDVTGSLCENNDKFAIQRTLPKIDIGDRIVICDAGAHGHAMGFQYNGKLRSAELLLEADGSVREIRRAETLDDYFATLDFSGLNS